MKPLSTSANAVAAIVALVIAVLLIGNTYLINLMVVAALFTLPALGLSLLMGYTGQLSLGHAAFVGLGAYASAWLARSLDLNPWLAIAAATALSTLAAWLIGWLVFRLRGHHLAMATLAFGIIAQVVFVEWRSVTGGQDGLSGIPGLTVFGHELTTDAGVCMVVWPICIAVLLLARNLVGSPVGLAMRVVSGSEPLAASIGIASSRLKRQVMAISGAYAGLGGALYAHWLGYISPGPFEVGFSIKLLLIVALSGFAGVWSVVGGVLFVVGIGELLKPLGRFDVVVYGVLLAFVMIRCPQGLPAAIGTWLRRMVRGASRREGTAS